MLRALVVRFLLAGMIIVPAAAPWLASAQQPAPALTINQVDPSKYPEVRAVATVLDARGVPVSGLTAAQFQAFDGATQLGISSASAAQDATLGLGVMIVIDVSGSMAGEPLARAKQAATEFAAQLGPNDEAALISFNDQVTPVVGLTKDRQRLTAAIDALEAGGGTALYEAAQISAFFAHAGRSPRRAIVLLTDGENDAPDSQVTPDGALTVAKEGGVPIFTVGFGASPDAGYLQQLATATQGQYRAATTGTVSSVYGDLATLLRNQYIVTIQAPGAADGRDASLQVIAFVAGAPVSAMAPYKRGAASAVVALTQTAATQPPVTRPAGSSTSRTPALVVGALMVAALAAGAFYAASRWRRQRDLERAQLAVVAPNLRMAAAQGVPERRQAPSAVDGDVADARGRLIEKSANGAGRVHDLRHGPMVIGSSSGFATLVLPEESDVAPAHLRILRLNGAYRLHHTGGVSRKTLVGGKSVDFVILESGDEIQVGRHHFVFEDK